MLDSIKAIAFIALIAGGVWFVWDKQRDLIANLKTILTLTILVVIPGVFGLSLLLPSSTPKYDPFESATKKIEAGHSDQLTKEERQRMDDLVNWCNYCKKPLRMCPHGK